MIREPMLMGQKSILVYISLLNELVKICITYYGPRQITIPSSSHISFLMVNWPTNSHRWKIYIFRVCLCISTHMYEVVFLVQNSLTNNDFAKPKLKWQQNFLQSLINHFHQPFDLIWSFIAKNKRVNQQCH